MKNPTLFDIVEQDESDREELFELFDRHEKEIVHFLEREYGERTYDEKLAVILTSCFVRAGHVCMPIDRDADELARIIDLDDKITAKLKSRELKLDESSIVSGPGENTPLVIENGLLYFQRYFRDEQNLRNWIAQKGAQHQNLNLYQDDRDILDDLFESIDEDVNWQKVAAALSLFKPFLIVSGGPGTGKTTTVARLLALQQRRVQQPLKIALAAPTGKAAGRMGEALFDELDKLDLTDEQLSGFPKEAQTIHRLLSEVEDRGLLPAARKKHLLYDIVIVDEASMIDLSLMNRLIDHLSDETKLILLGDKDQLASVEAGSVFADLCRKKENIFTQQTTEKLLDLGIEIKNSDKSISGTDDSIVYLTKSYRFDKNSGIGRLAAAVKSGLKDDKQLMPLFESFSDIEHYPFEGSTSDYEKMMAALRDRIKKSAAISDPEKMLDFWKSSVWLTILRRGLSGSERLNQLAEKTLAASREVTMKQGWYHGRPIIITRNDYDQGIFNGDHGVCMRIDEDGLWVFIQSGAAIKMIKPERLIHYNPAYFLTVHKSQGSEFNNVNLLLPAKETSLLSKELLYTAITRARTAFHLHGNQELFIKGSQNSTERFSGL